MRSITLLFVALAILGGSAPYNLVEAQKGKPHSKAEWEIDPDRALQKYWERHPYIAKYLPSKSELRITGTHVVAWDGKVVAHASTSNRTHGCYILKHSSGNYLSCAKFTTDSGYPSLLLKEDRSGDVLLIARFGIFKEGSGEAGVDRKIWHTAILQETGPGWNGSPTQSSETGKTETSINDEKPKTVEESIKGILDGKGGLGEILKKIPR